MKKEIIKMFREDGSCVQLIDFLKPLPQNDLVWSFLDFYGIGVAPNDLSMSEFEDLIRADATGYRMNWYQLLQFAESIEQTIDCLLVAVKDINDLHPDKLKANNFSSCDLVIQAFDSTEWELITK